jgi:hypothetical protein
VEKAGAKGRPAAAVSRDAVGRERASAVNARGDDIVRSGLSGGVAVVRRR